ncbi:MAG: prepilin-type N-terminal cleavage/methylation domain-containing protein [Bryobacterales bacterium]|nr:prepilin-type N-terminal cleavage/methylation domain-containing protein [Bryobacterales bacterium]
MPGSPPRENQKCSRAGVTLLELLLAISLLGLLSAGILTALRVGANAMQRANLRLIDNRRMNGVQRILEQQIAGFTPVIAACQSGGERPPVPLPFFQGERESMRMVSSYSLTDAWRGYPQILEFQVTAGARGEGVRLVVNEHLYTGPPSAGAFCLGQELDPELGLSVPVFRPIVAGPRSFVLADRLAFCRFSYLERRLPPEQDRWVERWLLPRWPAAVRIEMAPADPDRVRYPPLSLSAPIRITAQPLAAYGG